MRPPRCLAIVLAANALLSAPRAQHGGASGQDPAQPTKEPRAEVAAALGEWTVGDQNSDKLRERVVSTVLDAGAVGLAMLAEQLRDSEGPTHKSIRELTQQVVLGYLHRQQQRGMVYVGQYDELVVLQPFVGDFLFELLLDTPQWFLLTSRWQLVAPLRDLQPRLPSAERIDRLMTLVEDEREEEPLRQAVAAMLWQWGKKGHANRFLTKLIEATSVGDGEDRVNSTLSLADYYCLLREYPKSANAHRAAQQLAKSSGIQLWPVAWYAAACVHALSGDHEHAMEALSRCAELLASPHLDRSVRLERKLFEQDPEIATLRADARFPAILERAFGGREEAAGADGRGR